VCVRSVMGPTPIEGERCAMRNWEMRDEGEKRRDSESQAAFAKNVPRAEGYIEGVGGCDQLQRLVFVVTVVQRG
jgi:hypothetical protein